MNPMLLVLLLCVVASPGYAMTATVSTGQQGSPGVPGSSMKGNLPAPSAANPGATSAAAPDQKAPADSGAGAKSALPGAATLTRPAAVLSAPDVPPKSGAPTPAAKSQGAQSASTAQGARAKSVIVPPQVAAPVRTKTDAAWSTTAQSGTSMRRGTLDAFNVSAGSFQVFGQKLTFSAERVKVFNRDGRPGSIFALKNGAKVRFTIDSTDPAQRRVAVIYVD
ncbi:MAG: hypothetical protein ABI981_01600 [Betaproteobacteria bacterium]